MTSARNFFVLLVTATVIGLIVVLPTAAHGVTDDGIATPGAACHYHGSDYSSLTYTSDRVYNPSTTQENDVVCPVSRNIDTCSDLPSDHSAGVIVIDRNSTYNFSCYLYEVDVDTGSYWDSGSHDSSGDSSNWQTIWIDQSPTDAYEWAYFYCTIPRYGTSYSYILAYSIAQHCT
jgi:hypothetical protein